MNGTYIFFITQATQVTFRNRPYSLFLHFKRLCTDESVLRKRSKEIIENLFPCGYPRNIVNESRTRADNIPRQKALECKKQKVNTRIPFIINFNPNHPPIGKWIHELQIFLISDSTRIKLVLEKPPISGNRNKKSLRKILIPSFLPQKTETN